MWLSADQLVSLWPWLEVTAGFFPILLDEQWNCIQFLPRYKARVFECTTNFWKERWKRNFFSWYGEAILHRETQQLVVRQEKTVVISQTLNFFFNLCVFFLIQYTHVKFLIFLILIFFVEFIVFYNYTLSIFCCMQIISANFN